MLADQPDTTPRDRVAGQFMQYTSGTTGRPKAVQRDLPRLDPERWVELFSFNMTRYDIEPGGDSVHLVTSPMYHMAPLSFGYFSLHFEHTVVLMERWDAETALGAHRPLPRHRRPHGPDPAPSADATARRRAGEVRRLVAATGHPRRGTLSGRPQAEAVRLAGSGDLRVLRRHRGRGDHRPSRGLAGASGHRRQAVAGSRCQGARRRRQRRGGRDRRHRLHEADGGVRLQGRSRQDQRQPGRWVLHRRRHGRARR